MKKSENQIIDTDKLDSTVISNPVDATEELESPQIKKAWDYNHQQWVEVQ